MTRAVFGQIAAVYGRMAAEARYRPAAPSDGFGHITVPAAQLDLDAEKQDYAAAWWGEEDSGSYWLGCADFRHRKTMILAVEAARACCAADGALARKLLEMALQEMPPGSH
jgi:hypothetical protein